MTLVQQGDGAPNLNQAKPAKLRSLVAPAGYFTILHSRGHYYHFFANDILPLLHFLPRYGDRIDPFWVVVDKVCPPYVLSVLDAISKAFPFVKVYPLARDERLVDVLGVWHFRFAATYEWMPVNREAADQLTDILLARDAGAVPDIPQSSFLYVTRKGTRLRQLRNEAALRSRLEERGFSTFAPDAKDHRQQIETFRAAKVVVAVHGAALTNLLFCRPGTKVIEIFPANRIKSTYLWLAYKLGLDYSSVIGSDGDFFQNFSVDVDKVIAEL